MSTNKKTIYLFVQPLNTYEHDDIIKVMPDTLDENISGILTGAGGVICKGHVHFKKGIARDALATVLQSARDAYGHSIFFALSNKGNLWEVEPTGGYQHATPSV